MTLTSGELASMRAEINKLLPGTCLILSGTLTPDGQGEHTVTWGTLSTVRCRLDPIKGYESRAGESLQPYQRYRLTLPYDASLAAGYRVQIEGVAYNVLGVTPASSWELDTRAEVEKA